VADNQTWAVLPVKPFDEAKSRLDSVLSAKERHDLARTLLLHSLETLQACDEIDHTLVVSADPEALLLADEQGVDTLPEARTGLNQALVQARRHAMDQGAQTLLVLASDLPLVATSDIDAIFAAGDASVVIAPDRRRHGTNALLLRPPDVISFAFGEGSFERHVDLALASGVVAFEIALPGLAFDVDLSEDWHDLHSLGWRPDGANGKRPRAWAPPGPEGPGKLPPSTRAPRQSA
jgi:2-phospho-L-lactate guanylyltransferase